MTKTFVSDLDETLLKVDVSGELLMLFLRTRPFSGSVLRSYLVLKRAGLCEA